MKGGNQELETIALKADFAATYAELSLAREDYPALKGVAKAQQAHRINALAKRVESYREALAAVK